MEKTGSRLEARLAGYDNFLREKGLAKESHRPHLVRWVKEFLLFARDHPGHTFEQTSELFLAELGKRENLQPWQIRQAADALRIYGYQYRPASDGSGQRAGLLKIPEDDTGLLARLREIIRLRHYAAKTEKSYLWWTRKFLDYRRRTGLAGPPSSDDVKAFLTHLAMVKNVSASTQNQAFSALLLLFREVLHSDLKDLDKTVRAKRGRKLPTVLAPAEVKSLLKAMEPEYRLLASLLYGSGMRLGELLNLRVKDLDFEAGLIFVRSGKGDKDRTTLLPESLKAELLDHLEKVRAWHEEDLARGCGEAPLPGALARKYKDAGKSWGWQYAFPAPKVMLDPADGKIRRYHVYEKTLQAAIKRAVRRAGIIKHASAHTLRHSFATHLLLNGTDIREIQELLGHKSLETTMIYTHVARDFKPAARSPLDGISD